MLIQDTSFFIDICPYLTRDRVGHLPGDGSQTTSGLYISCLRFTVISLFRIAATSRDPNISNCIHITAGSDVCGCGHDQNMTTTMHISHQKVKLYTVVN